MLPLLYVVRMDVEPEYLDTFVAWYDTRHAPDLIAAGFHSCSAYHCVVGGPFICNVYEIPSVELLGSDAYVAVRQADRQLVDEVLHKIAHHSNTTYTQEAVVGVSAEALRPDDRPSRAGAVSAPVVATLRLDVEPEAEADLRRWYEEAEAVAQRRKPGFLRGRLARQHGKHPLFPSSQPDWLVLTEWATLDEALADGSGDEVCGRFADALGDRVCRLDYTVGRLSATLLSATTWTV